MYTLGAQPLVWRDAVECVRACTYVRVRDECRFSKTRPCSLPKAMLTSTDAAPMSKSTAAKPRSELEVDSSNNITHIFTVLLVFD